MRQDETHFHGNEWLTSTWFTLPAKYLLYGSDATMNPFPSISHSSCDAFLSNMCSALKLPSITSAQEYFQLRTWVPQRMWIQLLLTGVYLYPQLTEYLPQAVGMRDRREPNLLSPVHPHPHDTHTTLIASAVAPPLIILRVLYISSVLYLVRILSMYM